MIEQKLQDKKEKERKRSHQVIRFDQQDDAKLQILEQNKKRDKKNKNNKQSKLEDFVKINDVAAANLTVAKWALDHYISPDAMQGPYRKRMHKQLRSVCSTFLHSHVPQKMFNKMLPLL